MINYNVYKNHLTSYGGNLAQIRRNQSDMVLNNTFTDDPTYKRVYVLTKDGWKWEDAKYQFHFAQSIAKDDVDYYLQFRPKVHYPIGSYILIPNDTGPDLDLTEEELKNPFLQPPENRHLWWMIVDRDNQNAYVRYNVLHCNWNFQWIYNGQINSCYGTIRAANSYTSGIWRSEYSVALDNLTGFWVPDTHYIYGENLTQLGLDDTRTIMHDQRFMLTNNELDPKVYQVTKVIELSPSGLIKCNVKQDDYNSKRDNVDLKICDYYTNMGDMKSEVAEYKFDEKIFSIIEMSLDENDELVSQDFYNSILLMGKRYFYRASLGTDYVIATWDVKLKDDGNEYTDEEKKYYEGLIKLVTYDDDVVEVKPSKASSLVGKHFILSAIDRDGQHKVNIEWEVDKG